MEARPDINDQATRRLTKTEAYRIVQLCSYLQGQGFYESGALLGQIECVAVSPHDPINKWLFIYFYRECRDPLQALSFYKVPYYDVILIICIADDQITYRNLDAYHPPRQMTG